MRTTVILLILAAMLGIWYYPLMPERMASHFGAGGEANGWKDKDSFFILYSAMFVLIGGMFAGIARAIRMFPDSMINIPHKEYWLAAERRHESLDVMTGMMYHMGEATLVFILALMLLTFEANRNPDPVMGPVMGPASWVVIIVFLLVITWQSFRLVFFFKKPRAGQNVK
ncbi:MAG: DUF1648 domain-containing protein [Bacteroidetes bacterium]|nr:DUF1648 domain-containing protein [Bacteroidota bacterium]